MDKINAVITGVGGYVPEDVLTNEDISKMVDTTDEWIMTRVGIKERRILKGEGVGLSYMGIRAVKQLLEKTNLNPEEVEVVLTATTTPDHHFPTTSSIIAYHTGCKNAMTFDMQGACAGFLYALETGANYIRSGRYKKVVVVSGDKMTSITDYQDRSTCPLFGDACGAVLLEPTTEEFGVLDTILRTDGVGYPHLIMKSGGSAYPPSHETVDNREHFVYQDGRVVCTDERICFMGGNHRLKDLAAVADETGGAAFAMYPTSMEELMNIADEGKLMPPKSTWFEPKLRSGLFIHKLSD